MAVDEPPCLKFLILLQTLLGQMFQFFPELGFVDSIFGLQWRYAVHSNKCPCSYFYYYYYYYLCLLRCLIDRNWNAFLIKLCQYNWDSTFSLACPCWMYASCGGLSNVSKFLCDISTGCESVTCSSALTRRLEIVVSITDTASSVPPLIVLMSLQPCQKSLDLKQSIFWNANQVITARH